MTHFLSIIELFHDVGPSTIHSDDNDADATDQDRERLEWSTFEELLEHFKAEAKLNGTRIGRDNHNFKPHQFQKALGPNVDFRKVPSYGFLYCIVGHKQGFRCAPVAESATKNRKSECQWTIRFQFDYECKKYILVTDACNFQHSHPINLVSSRASSRSLVQYEDQLNSPEKRYVKQYGPAMLGMTKVRDILRLKYPDREFGGDLLSRLLKKGYAEHFGSDSDCMAKFMDLGNSIRTHGGVFKFQSSEDTRISDVFIMKPSMKAYAEIFGDFVINDGTHNVDKYGLVAIFNTLVDSLGKSVISCYSQYRSEHSVHISTALKYFGLDRKGATFMTDDGSAYHLVSSLLGMNHVLCTKHYHNSVFTAQAGLGHLAHEFQKCMFSAIYDDFRSPDSLDDHLILCQEKFGHRPAAAKFMSQLATDKEKVCRTHTVWIFSAGCKSTQRGEGTNSRMKGGGSKKAELRKYNLFQLATWYLDQVEKQEEETLAAIVKLISENREWSGFVQVLWQKQVNQVQKIPYPKTADRFDLVFSI